MAFLTKGLRIILKDERVEEDLEKQHENKQISELLMRAEEDALKEDGDTEIHSEHAEDEKEYSRNSN